MIWAGEKGGTFLVFCYESDRDFTLAELLVGLGKIKATLRGFSLSAMP